jgi:hypothetical protein
VHSISFSLAPSNFRSRSLTISHLMTFPNLRSGCDYYALQAFQSRSAREKLSCINLAAFVAEALAS